ncbi:MAG TPA: DUF2975 domain-containing protein [Microbacterium sp.]|nr:DUF2975 domain-containing protein [Microbacterium sp.]
MQTVAVIATKAFIAFALAVSLAAQVVLIPELARETVQQYPEADALRWPGIVGCVAIVACIQVGLVCVWRLLTLVASSRVFSPTAFVWVRVLIGAAAAATALVVAAFFVLASARAMAPGVMLALLLAFLAGAGITLLLVVMNGLLHKATRLEQDLAEVV